MAASSRRVPPGRDWDRTRTVSCRQSSRVDAEKIAQILRMDMIPECYIPSAHVRGIRNMVRQHVRLTQARTRVANRVHNLLDAHGEAIHAAHVYSQKALLYLDALRRGNEQDEFVLRQCTRRLRHYTSEIMTSQSVSCRVLIRSNSNSANRVKCHFPPNLHIDRKGIRHQCSN